MESTAEHPNQRPSILIVDDLPDNLLLLSNLLKDNYHVKVANSGAKALESARSANKPDLILLDIMMPQMSGYEVIAQLKTDESTRHIPVLFITALGSEKEQAKGLELGAQDYISKPFSPPILLARVKTHLNIKAFEDLLRDQKAFLEAEVAKRTLELTAIQDVTILVMASMAETRDVETGNHILRTQHYVKLLAQHLRNHPRFAYFLDDKTIEMLFKSAPLHDIGKVGIPDHILLKPGRYTPEEFAVMKEHPRLGREAIERAETMLGMQVEFLRFAKEISYSHQEKWDGTGYPQGLSGDDIPISARLMALADVYDALISRRVYKEPMPHEKARAIIVAGKNQHFDPDVVTAFLALETEFQAIAARYTDSSETIAAKMGQLGLEQHPVI
ncbi:MAG: two-component system response regulator [Burkholderiaceae bacterium]